jgi:polysaccharide deacetylase 2 family uncharacterized protein YibQ
VSRSRSRKVPKARFVAVVALLAVSGVVAFLVACPPAQRAPAAPEGQAAPAQPSSATPEPVSARPPVSTSLPPERPQPEVRGLVSIIIDDAGYDLRELQVFLDLPVALTIAVLPGLPHSVEAARRVTAAGKDLILHAPMEPDGAQDPGPGVILTGMSPERIRGLLDEDFAYVPGAIGMNNHMGSKATADEALMQVVLGYLKQHGKLFVDSRTTADTAAPRVARELDMPMLQRSIFLDDDTREEQIADWFGRAVDEAKTRGTAIAIGHVQNRGVADILRAAERDLASEGVRLARLTEVLARQERKPAP